MCNNLYPYDVGTTMILFHTLQCNMYAVVQSVVCSFCKYSAIHSVLCSSVNTVKCSTDNTIGTQICLSEDQESMDPDVVQADITFLTENICNTNAITDLIDIASLYDISYLRFLNYIHDITGITVITTT